MFAVSARATVVAITTDTPKSSDVFLVDSNVWKWVAYTKASQGAHPSYQVTDYPLYVKNCLTAGAQLLWTPLTFAELTSIIEQLECEIHFGSRQKAVSRKKDFRHSMPSCRSAVVSEVLAAWGVVSKMGQCLPALLDEPFVTRTLACFGNSEMDGYDVLAVEIARGSQVTGILTDDADFASCPGISVFTSNANSIRAAQSAGTLLLR